MSKDIFIARDIETAGHTDKPAISMTEKIWEKLYTEVKKEKMPFPLIWKIIKHYYGSEGDFTIARDQILKLQSEINDIIKTTKETDVINFLSLLKKISKKDKEKNLSLFGFAD